MSLSTLEKVVLNTICNIFC